MVREMKMMREMYMQIMREMYLVYEDGGRRR
jgi:hypothetical protein